MSEKPIALSHMTMSLAMLLLAFKICLGTDKSGETDWKKTSLHYWSAAPLITSSACKLDAFLPSYNISFLIMLKGEYLHTWKPVFNCTHRSNKINQKKEEQMQNTCCTKNAHLLPKSERKKESTNKLSFDSHPTKLQWNITIYVAHLQFGHEKFSPMEAVITLPDI